MDSIIRLIRRFTGITFAIFAGIIALNLAMLGFFVFKEINAGQSPQHVVEFVANHLQRTGQTHVLDASSRQMLEGTEAWAMLLDKGGQVIWDYKLPEDVPRAYSLTEVCQVHPSLSAGASGIRMGTYRWIGRAWLSEG